MQKWSKYLLVAAVIFIVSYSYGQGCSQCKLLAEQGSELDEASFGENINYGILYLMAAPYVLLLIFFRKKIVGVYKALTEKM
ncbi:MAG TPA: hypothetical protein EYG86_02650 [Crocinitomicaceae bacterium]|nr:hypothetical protein [Crocinitomicaceae bacterium]